MPVGWVLDSSLGTEDVVVGLGIPEGRIGKVVQPTLLLAGTMWVISIHTLVQE